MTLMAQEKFIDWRPQRKTRVVIDQANTILREYAEQGITMTLRGLHYQFVARGLYDNTKQNYDKLGNTLSQARLSGRVDWNYMEDRIRALDALPTWEDKHDIMGDVPGWYREDPWDLQKFRFEVHIEKDAGVGAIEGVCRELRVDFFACRGYVSASAQYQAAKRLEGYLEKGQTPIILHIGDHDPSGIDMTRENREKFRLLVGQDIEVRRLALNIDQVRKYKPPPNFAKLKDPRAGGYVRKFGKKSWELDALDPKVLQQLIRSAIEPHIDPDKWAVTMKSEKKRQEEFKVIESRWPEVEALMKKKVKKKKRKAKKKVTKRRSKRK